MLPQRFEFGDIDFFDIGEVRNGALRLAHPLGDQATQADHLDFGGFRGIAPPRHMPRAIRRRAAVPRSPRRIRPPGPVPTTVAKSIPASRARRRLAGEAITRVRRAGGRRGRQLRRGGRHCGCIGDCCRPGRCRRSRLRRGAYGGCRRRCSAVCRGALAHIEYDQRRTHRHFVARCAGDGHDAAAHRRGHFDRRLVGHYFDNQLILGYGIPRLGVPRDDFRIHRAFAQVRHFEHELAHADSMTVLSAARDSRLPGKILPFERVRIRGIPARHALDRRLQIPETFFLDDGQHLGAEPRETGGFVGDDAAARLSHRAANRIDIERHQGSQVDDLRIDVQARRGRGTRRTPWCRR